jgi:hypothetical protein
MYLARRKNSPTPLSPAPRGTRAALAGLLSTSLLLLATPQHAGAQTLPETPPPEKAAPAEVQAAAKEPSPFDFLRLGVTLEGFYEYNWNRPFDDINNLRAYDTRANSFGFQQAALVFESVVDVEAGRRFGGRIDLQFGQATETVQGSTANEPRPDVYRHVWQAYGTYVFPVGRGLTTDFGKFASMLGYETNYAKDNDHFSRAYLFNFLPFYHSGLRFSLPVSDKVTAMYMLTNGIQQTEDFNEFKSHHLAAIVKPTETVTWVANYYFGQEQPDMGLQEGPDGRFEVIDSYVTWAPNDRLRFGLDVNYTTNEVNKSDPEKSLQGIGAYARYQFKSPTALALRYERLDDEGLFGGIDQLLQEVTATVEYKFDEGFLMRGEFRHDWSDMPFFTGPTPGDLREDQDTALVGFVWWFGNKQGGW